MTARTHELDGDGCPAGLSVTEATPDQLVARLAADFEDAHRRKSMAIDFAAGEPIQLVIALRVEATRFEVPKAEAFPGPSMRPPPRR